MQCSQVDAITSKSYGFSVHSSKSRLKLPDARNLGGIGSFDFATDTSHGTLSGKSAQEIAEIFHKIFIAQENPTPLFGKVYKPHCITLQLNDGDTIPDTPELSILGIIAYNTK